MLNTALIDAQCPIFEKNNISFWGKLSPEITANNNKYAFNNIYYKTIFGLELQAINSSNNPWIVTLGTQFKYNINNLKAPIPQNTVSLSNAINLLDIIDSATYSTIIWPQLFTSSSLVFSWQNSYLSYILQTKSTWYQSLSIENRWDFYNRYILKIGGTFYEINSSDFILYLPIPTITFSMIIL